MKHRSSLRQLQRGISLVEILVGAIIGILGFLIIIQVYSTFEGQKRTTTSGVDAQENGNISLFNIERDIRMAGYGINNAAYLGCTIQAYDSTRASGQQQFKLSLIPVQITHLANGTDTITVTYGSSDGFATSVAFTQPSGSSANYFVNNRAGIKVGDIVIAAGPGTDSNLSPSPANVCELAEVNKLPGTPGQTDVVIHNSGASYVNSYGVTVSPTHNRPSGLGVTFSGTGQLYNLGPLPRSVTYSVSVSADGNHYQLVANDLMAGTTSAISEEIIGLRAQYGVDDGVQGTGNTAISHASYVADDGVIDRFVENLPANPTPADWSRVLAVRLAVLARSKTREKTDPTTNTCKATQARPTWGSNGTTSGTPFTLANTDWGCYRYRVFESVVPLRNMIWKQ